MMQTAMEDRKWGGGSPSERLRQVGGRSPAVFSRDADLAEALAELPPERQRTLAVWCAGQAVDHHHRHRDHPSVLAALQAVRAGRPLPDELASWDAAWATLDPGVREKSVATISLIDSSEPPAEPDMHPDATLIWVLMEAADPDSAVAVFGAVEGVLVGRHPIADTGDIRAEIRRTAAQADDQTSGPGPDADEPLSR